MKRPGVKIKPVFVDSVAGRSHYVLGMKAVGRAILHGRVVVFCLILAGIATHPSSLHSETGMECGAYDTPSDGGGSITVIWDSLSRVFLEDMDSVAIYRRTVGEEEWRKLAEEAIGKGLFIDDGVIDGVRYEYGLSVGTVTAGVQLRTGPVSSSAQWFNSRLTPVLISVLVCIAVLAIVMWVQSGGKPFYMRPIRGLQAVDEAVGRATEMGKPVLFTPGWGGDIQRPTTIAALNILRYVAVKTAEYRCELYFPTHDPVIMAAAEEVIREAYVEQGQGDMYNADNVFYTTSSQLGYAAAVDGLIARYKPAAVFLLGTFEGEALILAETGNSVGAMQVAGTDSTIQLSFFMVACDYTLIGEELFAASGYLTGDSKILSSVKVQDYLKAVIVILLLVGAVMATFGSSALSDWLGRT